MLCVQRTEFIFPPMQCNVSMYLWNVIKRFRETEMIVALNNSRVHKMIAWRDQNYTFQDWAGIEPKYFHFFFSLFTTN